MTSSKKVYIAADKTDDWCSCFSSTLQEKSVLAKHLPWGSGCFFWIWWMYIVLASVVVVLLAIGVLVYWYVTDRKMKKMKSIARANEGSDAPTRFGSSDSSAALVPSTAPPGYHAPLHGSDQHQDPGMVFEAQYTKMDSPHSIASDTSSIALLSSPSMSSPTSRSASRKSSPSRSRGKVASFGGESL